MRDELVERAMALVALAKERAGLEPIGVRIPEIVSNALEQAGRVTIEETILCRRRIIVEAA